MTWISISIYTHLHWLHIDVAQVVVQTLTSPGKTWVSALENNVTQLSQLKPRLIGGAALCSHLPRPTDRQSCEESRWRLNGFFVHPQIYPQMGKFGWFGIPSILKYLFIYLYILIIFDPHFIYNLVFFGLPWFLFLCYAAQVAVISFTATKPCWIIGKVSKWPFLWLGGWCLVRVWWELWATTTRGRGACGAGFRYDIFGLQNLD